MTQLKELEASVWIYAIPKEQGGKGEELKYNKYYLKRKKKVSLSVSLHLFYTSNETGYKNHSHQSCDKLLFQSHGSQTGMCPEFLCHYYDSVSMD